jgi:DHA1 family multidrug resistance protein-like MFS transporter
MNTTESTEKRRTSIRRSRSEKRSVDATDRRAIVVLSFVLLVVSLGYGIVIPVFPFVIEAFGGSGRDMGILVALAALTELIFAPVWGGLSDRVGRKRVLTVGVLGYGVSLLLMGFASRMWMLIAARALSGVLTAATMPTAMAYVSDRTAEADRGGGIGVLSSAAGLGIILGPGIGGWLGGGSLSLPFYVGAALAAVSLVLVWALLPEASGSAQRQGRQPAAPAETDRQVADASANGYLRRLRQAVGGAAALPLLVLLLASLGLANFEAVYGLYAAQRFGYGPGRVGTILVVIGVVTTLGKGLLTGPLTKRWGDWAVAKASMATGAVGYLILLAAYNYPTVLVATGLFILSKTVLRPALFALLSKRGGDLRGSMMGVSNTAVSLARVVGPLWAGFAFDLNLSYPYLSGAAVLLIGFVVSLVVPDRYAGDSQAGSSVHPIGSSGTELGDHSVDQSW